MFLSSQQLDKINRQLADEFGYFDGSNPRFRLVWSQDQFEKRQSWYTADGFLLSKPVLVEMPKYRQWAPNRYILEQLVPLPENHEELAVGKISYEPMYTFENGKGEPTLPIFAACRFVIKSTLDAAGIHYYTKYKEPTTEEERQARIKEIDMIEESLYGNETKVGDALAQDHAVGYGTRQRSDGFDPSEKINSTMEKN